MGKIKRARITTQWLDSQCVCGEMMIEWTRLGVKSMDGSAYIRLLMREDLLDSASYLITKLMTEKEQMAFVHYAVKQIIDQHRGRVHPQIMKTFHVAEKCVRNPTKRNRKAAEHIAQQTAEWYCDLTPAASIEEAGRQLSSPFGLLVQATTSFADAGAGNGLANQAIEDSIYGLAALDAEKAEAAAYEQHKSDVEKKESSNLAYCKTAIAARKKIIQYGLRLLGPAGSDSLPREKGEAR